MNSSFENVPQEIPENNKPPIDTPENNETSPIENEQQLRESLIEELRKWRKMVNRLGTVALVIWGVNTEAFDQMWNSDIAQKYGAPKAAKELEKGLDIIAEKTGFTKPTNVDEIEKMINDIQKEIEDGKLNKDQLEAFKVVFEDVGDKISE